MSESNESDGILKLQFWVEGRAREMPKSYRRSPLRVGMTAWVEVTSSGWGVGRRPR
jgi:hypothetical protein